MHEVNRQRKDLAEKPKVIVICGPTGIGKTSVAIRMARHFGGEIVSADSMQIYRFMDIGTAKPDASERKAALHHLIDIVDPDTHFDAAQFAHMASGIIAGICRRQRIPIVAGGTGLYIKTLIHGIFQQHPADKGIRSELKNLAKEKGLPFLFEQLKNCDPAASLRIHPNDEFRIIRALEVFKISGKPISDHHQRHRFTNQPFQTLKIGLFLDRPALYDRINRRVDTMIEQGFIEEVKDLLGRGYSADLKSMNAIGYRHVVELITGQCSLQDAMDTMKRDTRRYAKRQMTWFRTDPEIIWVESDDHETILEHARRFLKT